MKIHQISTTHLQENSYLLEENGGAVLIDAGSDANKILEIIENNNLVLKKILITHGHNDHTDALEKLKKETKASIFMSKKDVGIYFGTKVVPDVELKDGLKIEFGEIEILAISTPGHTAGSFCFYIEKENVLFSGDTLFKRGIGRTDLPTSSEEDMQKSLKKLFSLPLETVVLPGHGLKTTIKDEKKYYNLE